MKLKKVIEVFFLFIAVLLTLWAVGSWIEVICRNLNPNPTYSTFNFFIILTSLL